MDFFLGGRVLKNIKCIPLTVFQFSEISSCTSNMWEMIKVIPFETQRLILVNTSVNLAFGFGEERAATKPEPPWRCPRRVRVGETRPGNSLPWSVVLAPNGCLSLVTVASNGGVSLTPLTTQHSPVFCSLWNPHETVGLCEVSEGLTVLGCKMWLFTRIDALCSLGKMAFIRPHSSFPFELLSENWPDTHLQSIWGSRSRSLAERAAASPGLRKGPLPLAELAPELLGLGHSNQVFAVVSWGLYVLIM